MNEVFSNDSYSININNDNKQFNKEHCEKIQKDFKELYREMLENIKKGKSILENNAKIVLC